MDNKQKIEKTIADLEKRFGSGIIYRLGGDTRLDIERFSSGSLLLDRAMGGGVPRGRIIEVYGPESSGKTTLCQHMVAEAQKAGQLCAFIDMEHALDPKYAAACGVDISNLYVSQPDTGEQALEIAETLVKGEFDLIIVDSVAALVPRAEIEGEMGDAHVGLQARLMSQAMRKLNPLAKHNKTTIVFTNQIRHRIGVMFGSPEVTSGGNALKFYASVRLDVRRTGSNKTAGEVTSNTVVVKVKKNKTAPPFQEASLEILFGTGIDAESELIDLAIEYGLMQKSGAWFKLLDPDTGEIFNQQQGKPNMRQWLVENPEVYTSLRNTIVAAMRPLT